MATRIGNTGYKDIQFTEYDVLRFNWAETELDYETNYTTISWNLQIISGAYGAIYSTVLKNWRVYTAYDYQDTGSASIAIDNNETKTIASGSYRFKQKYIDGGTLKFFFEFSPQITFNGKYISTVEGNTNALLTAIHNGVKVASAPNFTDEDNPTITYLNQYGNDLTSLQACISFDGSTPNIAYRDISITAGSYTFNLTAAERKLLRQYINDTNSRTVYFFIKTVIGDTTHYNHLGRSCTIINNLPTLAPTVFDTGINSTALTGDITKVIKGFNSMQYAFNAAGVKEATIVAYKVSCGNAVKNYDNDKLYNVESGTFEFTVIDSRGNSATKTVQLSLIEYVKLTCDLSAVAPTTDGDLVLDIEGKCFNGSFGAVSNTLSLYYRIKENDEAYGDWVSITGADLSENEYSISYTIGGLNYLNTYTVQVKATDKTTTVESIEIKLKTVPVFDWSENDFNFNVPVTFMGDTMADIVIETGTESMGSNGTWYWRKWQSGKAECYGCRNYGNMGVSTAWGGLYRSEAFSQSLPSIFKNTPEVIDITYRGANFGGWIARHESSAPTATSSGGFILVRPASATISQVYISFNIVGRWK